MRCRCLKRREWPTLCGEASEGRSTSRELRGFQIERELELRNRLFPPEKYGDHHLTVSRGQDVVH